MLPYPLCKIANWSMESNGFIVLKCIISLSSCKSDITAREIFHPYFFNAVSILKSIINMILFIGYTVSYPEEYSEGEQNKWQGILIYLKKED